LKCENCGTVVNDEDLICPSCNAELSNMKAEQVKPDEVSDDTELVESNEGSDTNEENSNSELGGLILNEDGDIGEEFEEEMKPAKSKTGLIVGLSSIAVLIIGIVVYTFFLGGYDTITSLVGLGNNHTLVYVKDGAFYVKDGNRQSQKISNNIFNDEKNIPSIADDSQYKSYTMIIKEKNKGKLLYFFDKITTGNAFSGNLNVYELGGKPKKISDNASLGLTLNENGRSALFLENLNQEKGYGDLYLYDNGVKSAKLGSGVQIGYYLFSNDGKTVAYVDNADKSDSKWDLYMKGKNAAKEKIDTGLIIPVDLRNDGSSIIYAKGSEKTQGTFDLYLKEKGKATKCIANAISDLTLDKKNQSIFTVADFDSTKQCGNLYFIESGKDKVKVDDTITGLVKIGADKFELDGRFQGNQNSDALYIKNLNQEAGTGDLYFKHANDKAVKVASNAQLNNIQFNDDLSKIVFYNSNATTGEVSLFTSNASSDKSSFNQKSISSKVGSFGNVSKTGNVVVYPEAGSDANKFDLKILNPDGNIEKIGEDVNNTGKLSNDGKYVLYQENKNGALNLFLKQQGKAKAVVVNNLTASDKYYTYDFKKIYYTTGYDATTAKGDLYVKEMGKEPKKVDTGVSIVLYSE